MASGPLNALLHQLMHLDPSAAQSPGEGLAETLSGPSAARVQPVALDLSLNQLHLIRLFYPSGLLS